MASEEGGDELGPGRVDVGAGREAVGQLEHHQAVGRGPQEASAVLAGNVAAFNARLASAGIPPVEELRSKEE